MISLNVVNIARNGSLKKSLFCQHVHNKGHCERHGKQIACNGLQLKVTPQRLLRRQISIDPVNTNTTLAGSGMYVAWMLSSHTPLVPPPS